MPADTERLEARVREALSDGVAGYRGGDPAAARHHVLGGVRRLRRRRLQLATGGFVVALALVVTLPLAVSGGPATPPSRTAVAPSMPPNVRQPVASSTEATCTVRTRGAVPCGLFGAAAVFGTSSAPASASPSSTGTSAIVGTAAHPLGLRVGHDAVVELPRTSPDRPWRRLRPVVDPLPHSRPIADVVPTARTGVWRIVAEHAGTAAVQAERPACSGDGATCQPGTSTWTLYVEVTS